MHILVIEDEPAVQTLIKSILKKQDYETTLAETAETALESVHQNESDAIIMDLGLPDGDGFDLCKTFRDQNISSPILILSGENDTETKVKCLNAGADDFITKPFDSSELIARLNAITRRTAPVTGEGIINGGELILNKIERTLHVNGNDVKLTNNEFDLLGYLMENEGEIRSRYQIHEDLWDIDFYIHTNFVNVYISYLRKKIREFSDHKYIKTIRNEGFVFNPPAK